MTDATTADDADVPACRACGDRISETDARRVATAVEDGKAVYRRFCDDGCFEEWRSAD